MQEENQEKEKTEKRKEKDGYEKIWRKEKKSFTRKKSFLSSFFLRKNLV